MRYLHSIKHYDEERQINNKLPIPINVMWTDNCPTQYKCRQNFLNVAQAAKHHGNKTVMYISSYIITDSKAVGTQHAEREYLAMNLNTRGALMHLTVI